MTNGTFPILIFTSIDYHTLSHTFNRLKRQQAVWATSHPELQWLSCHSLDNHHYSVGKAPKQHYNVFPLEHYKNPLETEIRYATPKGSHISSPLLSKRFLPILCLTWASIFYAGKKLAQSLVARLELSMSQPREKSIISWPGINRNDLTNIFTL